MNSIIYIINIITLSFSIFSLFIVLYLIKLYKHKILKQIANILGILLISYASGLIFYGITQDFPQVLDLLDYFLTLQVLLIIGILFNLFNFLHRFTNTNRVGKRIIPYYLLVTLPIILEILTYLVIIDFRLYTSFTFQALFIYTGSFFLTKDKYRGNKTVLKLRADFIKAYKINILVFLPLFLISDICGFIWKIDIFWEPLYFLQFSLFTLIFSLRYIIIKSKESVSDEKVKCTLEKFLVYYEISERETEVLKLLLDNKKYKDISEILCISMPTVKTHVSRIYKKCNVSGKGELKGKFNNHT